MSASLPLWKRGPGGFRSMSGWRDASYPNFDKQKRPHRIRASLYLAITHSDDPEKRTATSVNHTRKTPSALLWSRDRVNGPTFL